MGKRKSSSGGQPGARRDTREASPSREQGVTLKDALGADVLAKLKAQAEELKTKEKLEAERRRVEAEEQRRKKQKELDNNFEYLLNNSSMDWKEFKQQGD